MELDNQTGALIKLQKALKHVQNAENITPVYSHLVKLLEKAIQGEELPQSTSELEKPKAKPKAKLKEGYFS